MEIVTQHKLFYSNKEVVPLGEIAESLLALERIIKFSPNVLENLFPGTKIMAVNVFIEELKSGSIYEDIFIKFVFGTQQRMDEFISSSRKTLGVEYISKHPKIFSTIILAIILSGGIFTLKNSIFKKEKEIEQLEIKNEVIINYGSDLLQMPPEKFQLTIENCVKEKEKVTKNAIKLIRPARRDRDASITFDDSLDLTLAPQEIHALPSFVQDDELEETLVDFKNVEIIIRATDLDSKKRGWAAIIPSIAQRRTRLQLDPLINTSELMTKPSIYGDVSILFQIDEEGNEIPKIIYLRKIIKTDKIIN